MRTVHEIIIFSKNTDAFECRNEWNTQPVILLII